MNIQDKIRSIREMHQWTQEIMAEKRGMSASAYAKLERGDTKLQLDKLKKIAEIFNMDISELVSSNKGMVFLLNENWNNNWNNHASYYVGNTDLATEIEKLKLIISHQAETIEQKNVLLNQKEKEIEALNTIIDLMKKQSNG